MKLAYLFSQLESEYFIKSINKYKILKFVYND
jgi:hypothetical protein